MDDTGAQAWLCRSTGASMSIVCLFLFVVLPVAACTVLLPTFGSGRFYGRWVFGT